MVGLERNEVRTARVLTWLLDRAGSHGFQNSILSAIWEEIPVDRQPFELGIPLMARRETIPMGDSRNRVDIEIPGHDFLLLIEVKIDAAEQPDQLQRYVTVAKAKAAARNISRYGVLYLTRAHQAMVPESCVHVSWLDVAKAIEKAASRRSSAATGTQLAKAFAAHVRAL